MLYTVFLTRFHPLSTEGPQEATVNSFQWGKTTNIYKNHFMVGFLYPRIEVFLPGREGQLPFNYIKLITQYNKNSYQES